MKSDPYVTFIGAKGVAFAWLGVALGPVFLLIGLDKTHRIHLVIGLVSLMLVALSVRDGIKAYKHGSISGFSAFAVVPAVLLVVGVIFAWLSGVGSSS
jgi:hypothetical protein